MLQLNNVTKSYTTGDLTQQALDDVSIEFRDNEFVAILGPSGSGKTTLLNIVGGLDHYDSGSIIVDDVDTSTYSDHDWDTYRNNRIGFVFQSYNLITHQSVLANVELALTLSGVSRSDRRQRALAALRDVGLEEHAHKRPNQLSGGQMQRVAIARALVNDPEIVLADEPTGALDSVTSEQIMHLLTGIAQDRLVIMVTHNPDLADRYATRIVTLKDGTVSDDSNPIEEHTRSQITQSSENAKTSMGFLTALGLSFNNLMTKKGRTLMTSFAGSIGIIGIALILALANGVNSYIKNVEEDTLSVYPLQIFNQGLNMSSMLEASAEMSEKSDSADSVQSGHVGEMPMVTNMFKTVDSNDLTTLKRYLDSDPDNLDQYARSIEYRYNVRPQIFADDMESGPRQVNPDTTFASLGIGAGTTSNAFMNQAMNTDVFNELGDDLSLIEQQYDMVAGHWPTESNEALAVLTPSGKMSDFALYALGLRDPEELKTMVAQFVNQEDIDAPDDSIDVSYDDIMGVAFKVVNAADYYVYDETHKVWTDKRKDQDFVSGLVDKGKDLRVVGIVQPAESVTATALQPGIYYTSSLVRDLMDEAADSDVVAAQLDQQSVNILTGRTFADEQNNPRNSGVDFKSLISVDQDALAEAFTFDESQLAIDPSALNVNLNMPGLTIDPSMLPTLSIADMLGSVDMSSLMDGIDIERAMASVDWQSLGMDAASAIDPERLNSLVEQMMTGYFQYCMVHGLDASDVATNFAVFLDSEEGKALLAQNEDNLNGTQADLSGVADSAIRQISESIGQQMDEQIAAQGPALAEQMNAAMSAYMNDAMTAVSDQISAQVGSILENSIGTAISNQMSQLSQNMSAAMGIDEDALARAFNFTMDEKELSELIAQMMMTEPTSYDANLSKMGYADPASPSRIDIFPADFESKGEIITILDSYNEQQRADGHEEKVIHYSDLVGTLMSSVTTIINVVSYVLIAFVAISLIVSSIMIGVITYISVLERKKEIGILRAIGASKRDIRRVFNAETLIVGLVAGLLGIGISALLTIPANLIVAANFGIYNVAILPVGAAAILVAISMFLTFIAGLIPSSAASRKDPVEALRSE